MSTTLIYYIGHITLQSGERFIETYFGLYWGIKRKAYESQTYILLI